MATPQRRRVESACLPSRPFRALIIWIVVGVRIYWFLEPFGPHEKPLMSHAAAVVAPQVTETKDQGRCGIRTVNLRWASAGVVSRYHGRKSSETARAASYFGTTTI